jgi:hypothetical protein
MTEKGQMYSRWTYLLRWRWYPLPAAFLAIILSFYIGATTSLSSADASSLNQFWQQLFGNLNSPIDIFLHNFEIALIMIVPVLGAPFAMYVGYSSGIVISAVSQIRNVNAMSLFLFTVGNPIAFLEFFAYALAITQGVLIFYSILKKHLKQEVRNTAITVTLVFAILLVDAFLEYGLVKGFPSPL